MLFHSMDKRILFVFIIFCIAMGGAIEGFNSNSVHLNSFVESILPLSLLYLIVITKYSFVITRGFVYVIIGLLAWQIGLIIYYGGYSILLGRFYGVFASYILLTSLGIRRFLYYMETAVAKLALISIILWIPIALYPDIRNILIPFSLPINETGTICASWGVFGIASPNTDSASILIRNVGFAWEPGRFSCIVVLALLINLFRNNFMLGRRNFWPLFLALLSSQSTTGYMTFIVCILCFFKSKHRSNSTVLLKLFVSIGFLALFFLSPFMYDKIESLLNVDTFITQDAVNYYGSIGKSYVPQRVEALFLDFLNIFHSPIIGYGDDTSYSYVQKYLYSQMRIDLSDGLLQIIAMLGIPLGLLFYMLLYRSSRIISRSFNVKGSYWFFLLICLINVSYNFFYEPFILVFVFCCLFNSDEEYSISYAKVGSNIDRSVSVK